MLCNFFFATFFQFFSKKWATAGPRACIKTIFEKTQSASALRARIALSVFSNMVFI